MGEKDRIALLDDGDDEEEEEASLDGSSLRWWRIEWCSWSNYTCRSFSILLRESYVEYNEEEE